MPQGSSKGSALTKNSTKNSSISEKQNSALLRQEDTSLESSSPVRGELEIDAVKWFKDNSIPITTIILILLIFSFLSHFGSATGWVKGKDITSVFLNIVQIVALCLAGWWFCFKFIRGRAYKESLIPAVSGKLITIDSKTYLVTNIRVKNVGQSVVEFAPEASSLKIFGYAESSSNEIVTVDDTKLAQFRALDDLYIEPNEIIEKTRFISIPNEVVLGLRLELEIISSHKKKYTWGTSSIVEKSPPNVIIDAEIGD